jgi:hypothetical protein
MTREDIIALDDLKKEKVSIPEWGGDFFVSEMTGNMRDSWEQSLMEKDSKGNIKAARAKLVVATLTDDQGVHIFKDSDIDVVGKKSSTILDKICMVAQRLNKLTIEDVMEMKKN